MAASWRGYRPIVVDGRRFRWACAFNHPAERGSVGYATHGVSWPPDTLTVRPEDGPHRPLTVTWPACTGPLVTPRLVRACLEEAIRRGWPNGVSQLELLGAAIPS
ncbi:MAG TPA: hypothetical protein VH092_11230 [Urbifossiella sp.]|jgi:hypothetical protein|nr:hypothetical protein [Urbifossiella sp.]